MKSFWAVITNLIAILVVIALYSSMYESSSKIILSLLIIVYANILSGTNSILRLQTGTLSFMTDRIAEIQEKMKIYDEDNFLGMDELRTALTKDSKVYIINTFSLAAMQIIGVIGLISNM